MTLKDIIRRYTFVHKCAGCGEILDLDHFDDAFCPECKLFWNASLTSSCKKCFKPAIECECMPKSVSKAGALCLRRLFFYESERARAPHMSVIYWLKYKKSRRIVDFVANELCPSVKDELDVLGAEKNDAVICGVPRSRKARLKYGFDQSEMVARALGKRLEIPYIRALDTRSTGKIQKKLTKSERLKNAKAAIKMRRGADVKGKYVVLFDDMVTTGASMAACTDVLRKSGAKGVLCFSLSAKQML